MARGLSLAGIRVISIKSECLDRMIFFGEESLRRACSSFVEHYHDERAYQPLGNGQIEYAEHIGICDVECTERLCGLLRQSSGAT